MSSTPPYQRSTWNESVDKLKNRLSVLSQSSMDDTDTNNNFNGDSKGGSSNSNSNSDLARLRQMGLEDDFQDGLEAGKNPTRSDFDVARDEVERSDEMRYDFFFYGTLMHPLILARVLGHQDPTLSFQDAILLGYVRHCVKGEDYPAILPAGESAKLLKRKLADDEACVRGTFVRGLTRVDVLALDAFEGDKYARVWIRGSDTTPSPFVSPNILTPGSDMLFVAETPPVLSPGGLPPHPSGSVLDLETPHAGGLNSGKRRESGSSPYFADLPVRPRIITLSSPVLLPGLVPSSGSVVGVEDLVKPDISVDKAKDGLARGEEGFGEVLAWVYVWRWDVGMLEREIWDLKAFLAEKSHRWTGQQDRPHGEHGGTSAEEIVGVYQDVEDARKRLMAEKVRAV